jgi:hypothetical protein
MVAYSPGTARPLTRDHLPPSRQIRLLAQAPEVLAEGGWRVEAAGEAPGVTYRLRLSSRPPDPHVRLELRIDYQRDLLVHQETLRFDLGGLQPVVVLDRAYRLRAPSGPAFSGPLTPHLARFGAGEGSLSFVGGPGVQGLWVYPQADGRHRVLVEIDHQENHPFRAYQGCQLRTGVRMLKLFMDQTRRSPGETHTVRMDWVVGPVQPVLVGRYPRGASAALVFTDHADPSDAARLEAFAFGRTGALADGQAGPGHPGFVNRGLGYTKTIFLRKAGHYAAQFEDPAYRVVLDELDRRGVEIGLHSVSGFRDRPDWSLKLLQEFRHAYQGRTWIDHQPDTNCEAIANLGWNPLKRWYMLGMLTAAGFRFAANLDDLSMPPGSLNLLAPDAPRKRARVVYRADRLESLGARRFVLFSSSWLFVKRERFLGWFSDAALDRFQAERGLLIGHVYFDTWRRSQRHSGRSLLEPDGRGGFRLAPQVDALFERLAQRQASGDLWVCGVEALSEHLLGAMETEITLRAGGQFAVRSGADSDRPGLTLLLPESAAAVLEAGSELASRRIRDGRLEVWLDLAAGSQRVFEVRDAAGLPVELIRPASILAPREGA